MVRKLKKIHRWILYWTTPDVVLYRMFNRIPKREPNKFLEDQRRRAERKKPLLFNVERYWCGPW